MKGIQTKEDLEARRWYISKNPIRLGKEGRLEIFLRISGLNEILQHKPLSDEQILRLYRGEQIKIRLREENPVYIGLPPWLKRVGGYVVDMLNKGRVKSHLSFSEMEDEVLGRVIAGTPYRR